jgi:hypothetical protein
LWKGPNSLGRKAPSLKSNELSLMKNLSSLRKHMFQNFLETKSIAYSFLCKLVTYNYKGVQESYNFIVESTSIRIHMKKVMIT